MLVIRRRAGESIQVGDEVELEVLEITPARVTLGVRAPRSVAVLRKEVLLTRRANQAAAAGTPASRLEELAAQLRGPSPSEESS
jgi:carbon storage regulator